VAKDSKTARAEGFNRGLHGKRDSAGFTQGWTDDKAATVARNEGFVDGKRKRQRNEAEKAARTRK
jgi:hypothetical protein